MVLDEVMKRIIRNSTVPHFCLKWFSSHGTFANEHSGNRRNFDSDLPTLLLTDLDSAPLQQDAFLIAAVAIHHLHG